MKRKIFIQICSLAMLLFLLNAGMALSAELEINDQEGTSGEQVTFNVSINNSSNELNSMEFNINYDSSVLSFRGWKAGDLVKGFRFFNAASFPGNRGVVKVAGLTSEPITVGVSGEIVQLTFNVNECQDAKLSLTDLQGAIEELSTKDGVFVCK